MTFLQSFRSFYSKFADSAEVFLFSSSLNAAAGQPAQTNQQLESAGQPAEPMGFFLVSQIASGFFQWLFFSLSPPPTSATIV